MAVAPCPPMVSLWWCGEERRCYAQRDAVGVLVGIWGSVQNLFRGHDANVGLQCRMEHELRNNWIVGYSEYCWWFERWSLGGSDLLAKRSSHSSLAIPIMRSKQSFGRTHFSVSSYDDAVSIDPRNAVMVSYVKLHFWMVSGLSKRRRNPVFSRLWREWWIDQQMPRCSPPNLLYLIWTGWSRWELKAIGCKCPCEFLQ